MHEKTGKVKQDQEEEEEEVVSWVSGASGSKNKDPSTVQKTDHHGESGVEFIPALTNAATPSATFQTAI